MTNDPIGEMLTKIRNGYQAGLKTAVVSYSKLKEKIAGVLVNYHYLDNYSIDKEGARKEIVLNLRYKDKEPVLTKIVQISKPGRRVYLRADKMPRVLSGLGMGIVSTTAGIITDKEARKKGLGGEIICKVW